MTVPKIAHKIDVPQYSKFKFSKSFILISPAKVTDYKFPIDNGCLFSNYLVFFIRLTVVSQKLPKQCNKIDASRSKNPIFSQKSRFHIQNQISVEQFHSSFLTPLNLKLIFSFASEEFREFQKARKCYKKLITPYSGTCFLT